MPPTAKEAERVVKEQLSSLQTAQTEAATRQESLVKALNANFATRKDKFSPEDLLTLAEVGVKPN